MATAVIDIVDGSHAKSDAYGWTETERVATVSGCTGTGQAQFNSAITAVGISMGTAHPAFSSLFLDSFSNCEAKGNGIVRVTLLYKRKSYVNTATYSDVSVGVSLKQTQTNKDASGTLITATYNSDTYSPTVSAMIQNPTIVYRRKETITSSSLLAKAKTYVGCVNSTTWTYDSSAANYTWLCTGITGTTKDGGATFDVTYTFEYRADTWITTVYYVGKDGKVPQDVTTSNGIASFWTVHSVNLNGLSLT